MIDTAPASADRVSLQEAIRELRHSSALVVRLVAAALRAGREPGSPLDARWGPEPTAAEFGEAVRRNVERLSQRRREVIGESLSRHDVARRLGVSDQAVSAMLERGALVGLKEGREWRIPSWQLDEEAPSGVVPGVAPLAARFPGGGVTLSQWVVRPHPDLEGETPRDALRRGEVERVLRLTELG